MAFGFSSKYNSDFPVSGVTTKRSYVIAVEAVKKLGWELRGLSESGFVAHTNTSSIRNWSEEVQIKLDFHNINIKSESIGYQFTDWGKNKRNAERFIEAYNSIKDNYSTAELDTKYHELEKLFISPFAKEDLFDRPSNSKKELLTEFFAMFQARNGYIVTPSIMGANVVVFIFMIALGVDILNPDSELLLRWGANYSSMTLDNEWWRLVSNLFLHAGIIHLLMNMVALLYVGQLLEPLLGKSKFFAAYLLTGVVASVSSLYWNDPVVSVGASGPIFGMYGVFLSMLTTNLFAKSSRRSVLVSIILFVAYNLTGVEEGIDHAAHVGGLVSGIVIGYVYYPSLSRPKLKLLKGLTMLFITVLVTVPSYFYLTTANNDMKIYEDRMDEVVSLETKALKIYDLPSDTPKDDLLRELKENGIPLLKENIKIIKGTDTLELPTFSRERNLKLLDYYDLRIKSYEILYKSISEDSEKYEGELSDLNRQIDEIVENLSE